MELTKLTQKFERDLQMKTKNKEDQKQLTLKYTKEKDKFEKNMTLKREKKKAESLITQMLPKTVAENLKQNKSTSEVRYSIQSLNIYIYSDKLWLQYTNIKTQNIISDSDSWESVDAKIGLTHLNWTPDTRDTE